MKKVERGWNDWIIVLIILVIGFACVIVAGQLALRFAPHWQLSTDMDSRLDPNSDFLTRRPNGFIEPVDSAILTQPSWINVFLTPGASFVTGTPVPLVTRTRFASPTPTIVSAITTTATAATSPTNTFVYIPPTQTATSRPESTVTSVPTLIPTLPTTSADTPTAAVTPSSTSTGTSTSTATETSTATSTATATATATLIPTDPIPPEIGTTPDGVPYYLLEGGTLTLGINLVANGDSNYDLVYYEFPAGSGVWLDWVIIEISDGNNWYTIFNWGNNIADTNTNVDFNILSPLIPLEPDQRDIPATALYNSTGIAIDIDAIVPPGAYSYIRFIAPTGDADGQLEIDALEILP